MLSIKRVYEEAAREDGFRILVDRIWPRGLKKENAHVDLWCKEIAPSTALRKWFAHDPDKWEEFREKYTRELADKGDLIRELKRAIQKEKTATLLYGARNQQYNQAIVLRDVLRRGIQK